MSIKKLLGTGACMVIIGVSAGASYGLFQRLTAQVASPAIAETSPDAKIIPSSSVSSQFVAAGVTTWTAAEQSEVVPPLLVKPAAIAQPEPPLLRYVSVQSDDATRMSPTLPLYAHIDDAVVIDGAPKLGTSSALQTPVARPSVAREVTVAAAPLGLITPGTLRRFRGQGDTTENNPSSSDQDGTFEQEFPPRAALRPLQPRRPIASDAARAANRNATFRRVWSTGVYR